MGERIEFVEEKEFDYRKFDKEYFDSVDYDSFGYDRADHLKHEKMYKELKSDTDFYWEFVCLMTRKKTRSDAMSMYFTGPYCKFKRRKFYTEAQVVKEIESFHGICKLYFDYDKHKYDAEIEAGLYMIHED